MSLCVCTGATMTCTFGIGASTLIAIPKGPPVNAGGPIAATIMDFAPFANIPPFGMCSSILNPAVAAATAAALGVLTPMPCIPATAAPWIVGSPTVLINNFPALNQTSTCICSFGGVITIASPGEFTVMVP